MGGWEPYALEAPSDRLLPFVLSRQKTFRNAPWISCAWLEHADTGARIVTLVPTGSQPRPTPVPPLGIVFSKQTDPATQVEYFTYDGALIPGLEDVVPCGVPLRLVVDAAYQSPRFLAIRPAPSLNLTHLLLEWYHDGPLQGVPYGRGFRQRFYIDNGSLQPAEPVTKQESTPDPNGGIERLDSYTVFAVRAFALSPVPPYLFDALTTAPALKYMLADGSPWRLTSVKTTPAGIDAGRWSVTGTLQDETPLLSRGCTAPALAVLDYPAGYTPRAWRCGDTSDTAADFVATGIYSCQTNGQGENTGLVIEATQDINPNSPTYGQTGTQLNPNPDPTRCPLPDLFFSVEQTASARRNNCGPGYTGAQPVSFTAPAGHSGSRVSQADADLQALNYAKAQAQLKANTTTSCVVGRSVDIRNVVKNATSVEFDLVRSDTVGDLTMLLYCRASVDCGGGAQVRVFSYYCTIYGGQSSLSASFPFGGCTLVNLLNLEIQSPYPSDYIY